MCQSKKGFSVKSYGSGDRVKIPGPAIDKPNVYDFGVTYDKIFADLCRKDKDLFEKLTESKWNHPMCIHAGSVIGAAQGYNFESYTRNGILNMLDRNRRIKECPERFQNEKDKFDIVITCEERVYDQVIEYLESQESEFTKPVHVINIDIQDNHEEATLGAFLINELANMLIACDDIDNDIDELLQDFESHCNRSILHCVQFY